MKDQLLTFKGAHYPKDIILHAGFSMTGMPFFIATMDKFRRKGALKVDHATFNHGVVYYSFFLTSENHKHTVAIS